MDTYLCSFFFIDRLFTLVSSILFPSFYPAVVRKMWTNVTAGIQRGSVRMVAPASTLTAPSTVTARQALWVSAVAWGLLLSPTCRLVMLWLVGRSLLALLSYFLSSSPSSSSSLHSARRSSRKTTRGTIYLWCRTQPLQHSLTRPMVFSLRPYTAPQETLSTCTQSQVWSLPCWEGVGWWDLHRSLWDPWHTRPVSKETHVPR